MSKRKNPADSRSQEPGTPAKRRRNVIFITLDDAIESALQRFIDAQRIKPDRAAVGLTALIEFLDREGFSPSSTATGK